MTQFELYIFTRLDTVIEICKPFAVLGTISTIFFMICFYIAHFECNRTEGKALAEWTSYRKMWRNVSLVVGFIAFCALSGTLLIPTQKEMAAIYLIPKIVANEDVKAIPADAVKLLHLKMEEYINESTAKGKK